MDSGAIAYLLQGLLLGLAYLAPIGMQNMYVINTALRMGRVRTCQVVAATTAFDISLALSCFFGIGLLLELVPALRGAMLLIGCVLVVYFGVKMLLAKPAPGTTDVEKPLREIIVACFAVTWLNPQAVLDGTMLLGGMRATLPPDASMLFILGVMAASVTWFTGLATATGVFKKALDGGVLRFINVLCGLVIIIYGLNLGYGFISLFLP
ncbi:MAG: arginine exporter protein [Methanocella sp. PtaU1.Bin125]|nr:MAG: arginine exporter protein [Methanocella sp. PtaU1.Bin125]